MGDRRGPAGFLAYACHAFVQIASRGLRKRQTLSQGQLTAVFRGRDSRESALLLLRNATDTPSPARPPALSAPALPSRSALGDIGTTFEMSVDTRALILALHPEGRPTQSAPCRPSKWYWWDAMGNSSETHNVLGRTSSATLEELEQEERRCFLGTQPCGVTSQRWRLHGCSSAGSRREHGQAGCCCPLGKLRVVSDDLVGADPERDGEVDGVVGTQWRVGAGREQIPACEVDQADRIEHGPPGLEVDVLGVASCGAVHLGVQK